MSILSKNTIETGARVPKEYKLDRSVSKPPSEISKAGSF